MKHYPIEISFAIGVVILVVFFFYMLISSNKQFAEEYHKAEKEQKQCRADCMAKISNIEQCKYVCEGK